MVHGPSAKIVINLFSIFACIGVLSGCGRNDDSSGEQSTEQIIDQMIVDYSESSPGASVLVVQDGDVLYKKAFGMADIEGGVKTTSATNYRLASITKQFTATAIMLLVEQGKLGYDTVLTEMFEGFPEYGQAITLSHLLSHTSGLLSYESLMDDSVTVQVKDADILQMMVEQTETYFEPGSQYRYSNSGYAVLAMIVERYSGQRFAEFLAENIFDPLGMQSTIAFEDGLSTITDRAFGHEDLGDDERFVQRDQNTTSAVLGDGGIYSSVEDLLLWDQSLYTEKILPQSVFENAWTAIPATMHGDDDSEYYGYGWYVETYSGRKNLRHSGGTVGFRNDMERFPECRLTVIVLTNRGEPPVISLARDIADLYMDEKSCSSPFR